MSLPSISSYKDALRTPEHSLQRLSHLEPVPGVHDDFYFSSGNFAVVFKMEDTRDSSFKALKCFTRDQERRKESLHLISNYLNQIQSEYIIPYTYLEDEIWADDADHPVLLMDWIEGETLGGYVSKLCESHDRHGLERLCQEFVHLSLWLLDQPWAHGDLKHDNILVRPDRSLVLVDFDGCFVPEMRGQEAREMGSPSFRHPNRTIKDFDRHLDDFSILVIFLSLRILAAEPMLRQEQQDGENLVLSIGDISNPATSVMLEQFRRHSDSFLKAAIALLDMAVSFPAGQIFGLREVLKKWLDETTALALHVPAHMVYVRGGTFEMGDVMGDIKAQHDETVHTVTISNFLLAKNELTFDEFDAFYKATGRALPSDFGWGRGKRPVINVDWYDAIEYCNWRSGQEGLQAVYSINKNGQDSNNSSTRDDKKWLVMTSLSANGYRLPTEAEWEYAARAGGKKVRFGNGKDIADPKEINFDASFSGKKAYSVVNEYRQKTLPVGSFSPNILDLFDMSGNVWEWCGDWYGTYPSSASNDPQGATGGSDRVIRGGSWDGYPFDVRVANRYGVAPVNRGRRIGFRLARTIPSPEKQRELETWNKIPKNDLLSLEGYIRDNAQSSFVEEAQLLITAIKAQDHMVLVKGGTFEMGDVMGDKENDDETLHTVTLSNFLLAKNELTFDEYDAFCKATDRELPSDSGWGRGKRPVINVDWYDAIEYCNWRSGQEGLQVVYSINKNSKDSNNVDSILDSDTKKWLVTTSRSANGYRLPTEAEWEYAARQGGQKVRFGNGKDIANPQEINFDASSEYKKPYSVVGEYRQKTLPVGSFSPNTLDLFDMNGNVGEWCGDWYGAYPSGASNDPQGATGGSYRVIRGGSWLNYPADVRVANRDLNTPDLPSYDVGFRLARAIVSPEMQRELETWNKIPKNDLSSLEGYIRDNTQSSFVKEAQHLIATIQKAQDHMVLVKGGTFEMGEANKSHQVTLSDFLIAKHQLTFDEYDAFCKATGHELPDDRGWGRGNRPVINVTWFDAVGYCNWRSQQEGLGEVYQINQKRVEANWQASGYRLLTEAEWEYAARGGQQSQGFEYAGSNNIDEVAWYSENSDLKTQPIGQKKASELGLYDMSGNVWEWCWDWKNAYPSSATNDPKGWDTGYSRVIRGGSWDYYPAYVRVAFRFNHAPAFRFDNIGFRLARRQ
jgi:formylglycine-generating enzyme required for sulfatase activity